MSKHESTEQIADRLGVKIVSLVADKVENDGSLPFYDGIEAARAIRDLLVTEFKPAFPFTAMLFNEAREPHDEIKLVVCHETVIRNKMKYRLVEFSRDGAAYHWCGYDPTAKPTPTA